MKRLWLLALLWAGFASAAPLPVPGQSPCPVTANCVVYKQAVIYGLTGDKFQFGWGDAGNGTTFEYIFELRRFPPQDTDVAVATGTFPSTTRTWLVGLPKAGSYYLRGRSCKVGAPRDAVNCSRWAISYDPVDTEPVRFPNGFTLRVDLKPPTL